jgi:murein DD-endopeptidase MepM/ murein hydrolase activator NlpD
MATHPIGLQYRITQPFLQEDSFTKKTYRSGVHFGVDYGCPNGTPLIAPMDGQIVEVIRGNKSMGNAIRFECTDRTSGITSHRFLHLSEINCIVGPVKEGQLIGKTGNTGMGASYHLHWDIMIGPFVFNNLLSKQTIIDTMLDPVKWCVPSPISEKFDPLNDFTTQMLVEELITRPHYREILLAKIKL